ncbi:MAG: mevalonate kinase [Anaerolineales bacterium]|nr:mevalonate kinase [Anaerolineales bacterium]
MTSASAPGKIILFGEHAVVYGRPALAVPVTDVQANATVTENRLRTIRIEAPGIGVNADLQALPPNHPLAAVTRAVLGALGIVHPPSFTMRIESTIPVASGLGSGAAVSVAAIRALASFLGCVMPDEKVNALAFEIEKLHHGTPSGIDNIVVTYAKPVYFLKGCPGETFHPGVPFTIVIGDTGVPASTKESVREVRELWQADPARFEKMFDVVGEIVQKAREAIESGEMMDLGLLMDKNHSILQGMTVSSQLLDRLVDAARSAGALGAKLSGSGRGGNMIALVKPESAQTVAEALVAAGAKRTITTHVG